MSLEKNNDFVSLDNFTGPLQFLLQLIQRSEIEISDVPLQKITSQYLEKLQKITETSVESGADFIGTAATLLWVKSKMLLPNFSEESLDALKEEETNELFMEKLIEYYHCKVLSQELAKREDSGFIMRNPTPISLPKKPLFDIVSLEDLAYLFQELMKKTEIPVLQIEEKECSLSDKIAFLKREFKTKEKLPLTEIFSLQKTKGEIIVTFLAILELMKIGVFRVIKTSSKMFLVKC